MSKDRIRLAQALLRRRSNHQMPRMASATYMALHLIFQQLLPILRLPVMHYMTKLYRCRHVAAKAPAFATTVDQWELLQCKRMETDAGSERLL
jgi:hypothetical protein